MEKKKYYVNVGTQEVSQIPVGENDDFTIFATDEEVFQLREILNEMHDSDMGSFWRSHRPFKQYHSDDVNDDYDSGLITAYQLIHDLGDEKTKEHITSMDILNLK